MEPVELVAQPKQMLIAEDGRATAMLLRLLVAQWGYEAVVVDDGLKALDVLKGPAGPRLAILDWEMPGLDGPDVCRVLRKSGSRYVYLILLTAKAQPEDTIAGLEAGADDFINKPFDENELRCRLRTGQRIVDLESGLEQKVAELEKALNQVDTLEGMIPICVHCKRIRNSDRLWTQVEHYIEQHSTARFSHGICEKCLAERYPEEEEGAEPAPRP
jgi:DNA-binding response OmpR family regulator